MSILSDADRSAVAAYGVLNESANIARAATFVLDRDDVIRWKYVGQSPPDRPPLDTVLSEAEAVAR